MRLIPHNPPQKELEGLALLQVTARQPKNLSVGCVFEGRDSTCDIWLEGSHLSMVLWGPRMEKGSDIPWDVFPEGGIKALAVMKRQGGTKPCLASMPDHQSTREDAEGKERSGRGNPPLVRSYEGEGIRIARTHPMGPKVAAFIRAFLAICKRNSQRAARKGGCFWFKNKNNPAG